MQRKDVFLTADIKKMASRLLLSLAASTLILPLNAPVFASSPAASVNLVKSEDVTAYVGSMTGQAYRRRSFAGSLKPLAPADFLKSGTLIQVSQNSVLRLCLVAANIDRKIAKELPGPIYSEIAGLKLRRLGPKPVNCRKTDQEMRLEGPVVFRLGPDWLRQINVEEEQMAEVKGKFWEGAEKVKPEPLIGEASSENLDLDSAWTIKIPIAATISSWAKGLGLTEDRELRAEGESRIAKTNQSGHLQMIGKSKLPVLEVDELPFRVVVDWLDKEANGGINVYHVLLRRPAGSAAVDVGKTRGFSMAIQVFEPGLHTIWVEKLDPRTGKAIDRTEVDSFLVVKLRQKDLTEQRTVGSHDSFDEALQNSVLPSDHTVVLVPAGASFAQVQFAAPHFAHEHGGSHVLVVQMPQKDTGQKSDFMRLPLKDLRLGRMLVLAPGTYCWHFERDGLAVTARRDLKVEQANQDFAALLATELRLVAEGERRVISLEIP